MSNSDDEGPRTSKSWIRVASVAVAIGFLTAYVFYSAGYLRLDPLRVESPVSSEARYLASSKSAVLVGPGMSDIAEGAVTVTQPVVVHVAGSALTVTLPAGLVISPGDFVTVLRPGVASFRSMSSSKFAPLLRPGEVQRLPEVYVVAEDGGLVPATSIVPDYREPWDFKDDGHGGRVGVSRPGEDPFPWQPTSPYPGYP